MQRQRLISTSPSIQRPSLLLSRIFTYIRGRFIGVLGFLIFESLIYLQRLIMTDFDFSGVTTGKGNESELQEFLLVEKQKAQFNAQIHEFNDFCWEKCMDKPGNKLDSKTETCMTNCVDRFIDVSLLITNRFAQLLQKSGSM